MTLYYVGCAYDMGFNLGDEGVYSSMEKLTQVLESIDWSDVGYERWQDVEDDGYLNIREIEG